MYNYNRDVYQAEHERAERLYTAASRQVPSHLRSNKWKHARSWLSERAVNPVGVKVTIIARAAARHGGRYWRRASSRAMGLLFNGLEALNDIVPGRV